MQFPKRQQSNEAGVSGQSFFQSFVNTELKCIFHPIDTANDFGIDGYIELVVDHRVTGKHIGVQVKYGDSYFASPTAGGYKYTGENKHLNYYLNNQVPVYLVILDASFTRMNWVQFDIARTLQSGDDHWWIEVPNSNDIRSNFRDSIMGTLAPVVDYEDLIRMSWLVKDLLSDADTFRVAIQKDDIESMTFTGIDNFFDSLASTTSMLLKARSTIDIFFPDYDDDSREIFQVPEIQAWLRRSVSRGTPWFYFLDHRYKNAGLSLLLHVFCTSVDVQPETGGYWVIGDSRGVADLVDSSFVALNDFTERHHLDQAINEEISLGILNYLKRNLRGVGSS